MQMKKLNSTSIFGLLVGLLGVVWMAFVVLPPLSLLLGGGDRPPGLMFWLIIAPMMVAPGAFVAYWGFRLARKTNKQNVRRAAAGLSAIGVIVIASLLGQYVEGFDAPGFSIILLPATLLIALPYIQICKWLIRKEDEPFHPGELIGKGYFIILALEIWVVGSDIARGFAPPNAVNNHIHGFITAVVPIVLAVVFYKVSVFVLEKRLQNIPLKTDCQDAGD